MEIVSYCLEDGGNIGFGIDLIIMSFGFIINKGERSVLV